MPYNQSDKGFNFSFPKNECHNKIVNILIFE